MRKHEEGNRGASASSAECGSVARATSRQRVPLYLPALRGFMEKAEHFVLAGQVGVMLQRLLRNA